MRAKRLPDFFIIGVPKCGTTSLALWLSEHPKIFMCDPKEPNYYSPDLVAQPFVENRTDYERLFHPAGPEQRIGEASTGYLRSRVAVPRILSDRPDARLIVCLRNPVDMAPSVHAQLLKGGRLRERDFEAAWRKQDSWVTPSGSECMRDVCRLGIQVERVLSVVPRDQVLFLLLEDLRTETRQVYKTVLDFLGVDDDGRTEFPAVNTRAYPRSIGIARATGVAYRVKRRLGISKSLSLGRLIGQINNQSSRLDPAPLSPEVRRSLVDTFRVDIRVIGRFGRHRSIPLAGYECNLTLTSRNTRRGLPAPSRRRGEHRTAHVGYRV